MPPIGIGTWQECVSQARDVVDALTWRLTPAEAETLGAASEATG